MFRLVLVLLVLVLCVRAAASEIVAFESEARPRIDIRGRLARPSGRGPFPAVELLHSCLGMAENLGAYEHALTGAGYVTLFVDDFTDRGLHETCTVDFPEGLGDARGALRYLSRLPYVDPRRVAVVGFSQGADTTLRLAERRGAYRAAAAFYPPCANIAGSRLEIPTLILVGALDGVTPASDCAALAHEHVGEARLVVYPGASHAFDNPAFAGGVERFGMRLQYDRDAAERSMRELLQFLGAELSRAPAISR